jgi:hypothetical protein
MWSRPTRQTPSAGRRALGGHPPALSGAWPTRARTTAPLVASADGRPISGESGLRLEVDSRLSGVMGRNDRLLIAAGSSYVEALQTRQGFKSPPGAADNERKRLSLLPRTLETPPARPSAGSLPYPAYSTGHVHTRRLLLPAGPTVARAFRPAPPRRWVSSLAESAGAAAVLRPALDRSQRPRAGAATQAAAEVAM